MLNDERGQNSLELVVAGLLMTLGNSWILEVAEHHGARLDQAAITFRDEALASATRDRKQMKNENLPMESSKIAQN